MKYLPLGIAISGVMVAELLMVVGSDYFSLEKYAAPAAKAADY
ncbi:NADH:ubiquinone oxidoreductase subunit J, partial [Solemya elarraichensis gill symbiont]